MIALTLVRDGVVPAGTETAIAEAGGTVLLVGFGLSAAVVSAQTVWTVECSWIDRVAVAVAAVRELDDSVVVLPATPDGRDLAPRLAAALAWDLFAGAIAVNQSDVTLSRRGGLVTEERPINGPAVVTLIPRVANASTPPASQEIRTLNVQYDRAAEVARTVSIIGVDPPDPATIDLAESPRIVGGGQGLGSTERFNQLGLVGRALGAALGGTRVASDAGWIPFERQIGTTGVMVRPTLYLAFGISGATQHTSGLGDPDHVISVNVDPSCPMMSMADLAIVSDARAVLDALAQRLTLAPLPVASHQ